MSHRFRLDNATRHREPNSCPKCNGRPQRSGQSGSDRSYYCEPCGLSAHVTHDEDGQVQVSYSMLAVERRGRS
jgi:hypothetical protein